MEPEVPPTEPSAPTAPVAPIAPTPTAVETAHERHTRELTHSVEVLEGSVEHGLVRMLKLAVPVTLALIAAAVGSYLFGQHLRDRSEQRRVDRAIRKARAEVTRRARAALADAA